MKTTLLISIFLFLSFISQAQDLAMADTKEKPSGSYITNELVLMNYGLDLSHNNLKEYPKHQLGDEVAKKIYATQKIYVRHHQNNIGFSDNVIEVYKPIIYNAITKLESYFKKAVRKNEMPVSTASKEFSHCLDIAYLAYYENNTEPFEKALKKVKTPEDLLTVFNSIQVK